MVFFRVNMITRALRNLPSARYKNDTILKDAFQRLLVTFF
ncbi:hypothetical protein MuM161_p02 [Shewanella phage vB_SspS_MuM16-1]|nr:hypothetical protein MuM161_p02 [Shewanella phage vB_SspS_MuM16-1]